MTLNMPAGEIESLLACLYDGTSLTGDSRVLSMSRVLGRSAPYLAAAQGRKRMRYWTPAELLRTVRAELGPTKLEVDCYFGPRMCG